MFFRVKKNHLEERHWRNVPSISPGEKMQNLLLDTRNPAPVHSLSHDIYHGFYTSQGGDRRMSEPSTTRRPTLLVPPGAWFARSTRRSKQSTNLPTFLVGKFPRENEPMTLVVVESQAHIFQQNLPAQVLITKGTKQKIRVSIVLLLDPSKRQKKQHFTLQKQ